MAERTALSDSFEELDGLPLGLGQDGAVAPAGTTAADIGIPWAEHRNCSRKLHTNFAALVRVVVDVEVKVDWTLASP